MQPCCTTQTRPTPPGVIPHADAVPAPRTSLPLPMEVSPNQLMEGRSSPQPQPAPSASPTIPRDAAATLETAELLQRAGKNDPGAWQEILRRYSGVVHGKIRAFRLQEADALDAVQMTWLRLAENIPQIQHPERLGGWLATTAARECLRLLHQAQRTPIPADAVVDNSANPAPSPEQCVIDAETAQTLRVLVAKLPPRRGKLLRALFTDDPPSYAELSHATGIPLGSIGPTRNRALYQLRQMLEDH
jgi:RNA polymerase sigma factor (sigma-70 family)